MQYCPQCEGVGRFAIPLRNDDIKEYTCKLCKGERFVTDEVYDEYRKKHFRNTYTSNKEKRKLADKLARKNIPKNIGDKIKDRARNLGKKPR